MLKKCNIVLFALITLSAIALLLNSKKTTRLISFQGLEPNDSKECLSTTQTSGYTTVAFHEIKEKNMLSKEEQETLLSLVRDTISARLNNKPEPEIEKLTPSLKAHSGAFVTIHSEDSSLRGCIGTFIGTQPVWEAIRDMAIMSAFEDTRFEPLRLDELKTISIEISILSPLSVIENPLDLELGVHGIYITHGGKSGCFLPQVATEQNWNKEEFLSYCCSHKVGIDEGGWKSPNTTTKIFTAEIFGEKK